MHSLQPMSRVLSEPATLNPDHTAEFEGVSNDLSAIRHAPTAGSPYGQMDVPADKASESRWIIN